MEAERSVQRGARSPQRARNRGRRPAGESRTSPAGSRRSIRQHDLSGGRPLTRNSRRSISPSRTTNLTSLDLSLRRGIRHALLDELVPHDLGLRAAGFNTYSSRASTAAAILPITRGCRPTRASSTHQVFTDSAHTFTQEVRLVSKTGPDKLFDYVLGVFYENQTRTGAWTIAIPGSPEHAGRTGLSRGHCGFQIADARPGIVTFQQVDTQSFKDKSVFGELTWHFVQGGQITVGARHFSQQFTDAQSYDDYTFPTHLSRDPARIAGIEDGRQGEPVVRIRDEPVRLCAVVAGIPPRRRELGAARRPFQESPLLSTYAPDSTNNYEAGLKGRFSNGFSYTAAVFRHQVGQAADLLQPAVRQPRRLQRQHRRIEGLRVRVERAAVRAAAHLLGELRLCGCPADQQLLAAGEQRLPGTIVPGLLHGSDPASRCPGSPKTSASVGLIYDIGRRAGLRARALRERRVPQRGAACSCRRRWV